MLNAYTDELLLRKSWNFNFLNLFYLIICTWYKKKHIPGTYIMVDLEAIKLEAGYLIWSVYVFNLQ